MHARSVATTHPWNRGPVTPRNVRAFVRKHLPQLAGRDLRFLSLSDFSTWEVDGRYILRFARNSESNGQLTREVDALPVLEKALAIKVPEVDLVMPYRRDLQAMGYAKLPGIDGEAFQPRRDQTSHLVGQFAELLTALQEIPASALHPDTPHWPGHDLEGACRHLSKHGHLIGERASDLITAEVSGYLQGAVPMEVAPPAQPVVAHCDIKGEHLLFDPDAGRLTGLIDWGDMCVTQPTIDLGALAIWHGPRFVGDVAASIGTPADVVESTLMAVRVTMLAGLARTFAGEKHWPVDLATTMIRRVFGKGDQ